MLILAYLPFGAQYGFNIIGSAEQSVFHNYELWTESWLLGRLALSRDEGILSHGGFLPVASVEDGRASYFEGTPLDVEELYFSQSGGQAFLLHLPDRLLPLSPQNRYRVFRVLFGLAFALVVWLVVVWLRRAAGTGAAVAAGLATLLAVWPSSYARHPFHASAFYLLPLVAGLYALRLHRRDAPVPLASAAALVFLCMLAKYLMNGLEFISTICVLALVPFVYECVARRIPLRASIRRLAVLSASICVAVGMGVAVLLAQIALTQEGGIGAARAHLTHKVAHRMHDVNESLSAHSFPQTKTSTLEVLQTSADADWIQPRSIASRWFPGVGAGWRPIPFWVFLLLFGVATAAFFLRRMQGDVTSRALLVSAWFSLLAPLSWFVVFKNHTAYHPHMVPVTWHLPFVFFAAALVGHVLAPGARVIMGKCKPVGEEEPGEAVCG